MVRYNLNEEMVIKNSMKLMRLINSNIVDKGIKGNKKNRKAYVYLDKGYLKGVQEEEMFRYILLYQNLRIYNLFNIYIIILM